MKRNSLKVKIWLYLIIFAISLLTLLWLFQVIFIDKFYELNKSSQIKDITYNIKISYKNDDIYTFIDKLAYEEDACIEVFNRYNTLYISNQSKGCIQNTYEYKKDFINSNDNSKLYKLINPKHDNKILIRATKLDDNTYLFVNASLEPLGTTVNILSNQLIIVSIIVLILALIIGYFISKKISKPIENITKSAKKMGSGGYDIDFNINSNIYEIDELANTLNYTEQELSKISTLQKELMANVSHDLKTPLTMIKGYAEMVRDLTYNNDDKRNEDLNIIIEESDRLTLLVNDILALSSIQATTLKIEKFDLIDLINQILKRYKIYSVTKGYEFIFNSPFKLIVKADKKRIEQVIYNLINNAINYTGSDNKVFINVIKNDIIRVEVTDTGIGISKDKIPYIWDKYYHSSNKHKRNVVGTGLGLSIVKSILESHNFNYGVETKKNNGTTFYFEIR